MENADLPKAVSRLPLPMNSTKRPILANASDNHESQPAQKRQRKESEVVAATTIGTKRLPAASARPPVSKPDRSMGHPAATVAAGPSRGVAAKMPFSATSNVAEKVALYQNKKASDQSNLSAGTKRPSWDLKGKVADMQGKLTAYQHKVKSSDQSNESLKAAVTEKDVIIREQQSRSPEHLEQEHKATETLAENLERELHSLKVKLSVAESNLACTQTNLCCTQTTLRETEEKLTSCQETVARQRDEIHFGEMERRCLHNFIQELKVYSLSLLGELGAVQEVEDRPSESQIDSVEPDPPWNRHSEDADLGPPQNRHFHSEDADLGPPQNRHFHSEDADLGPPENRHFHSEDSD